ncbi:uncharacterized protein LOC110818703 isoform X1 [Carica papaya]|uniref:uncharacterized protein LOC110818703 isoform X1 n=1 Tax=Carica papaya TaxID=3649 RepID=UPI000B8C9D19|nr:uncharacterized protein LOC110818703 isoform X1 [Carica papaya]
MMDVKLSQTRNLPFSDFFPSSQAIINFPSRGFSSNPRVDFKNCKRFGGRTERWRFHVQEKSKSQQSSNHFLVHVVKGGETLTSISKWYGVSTDDIAAANKDIQDIDLVSGGKLLYIPTSTVNIARVAKMSRLPGVTLKGNHKIIRILDSLSEKKVLSWSTAHSLPHVKKSAYFLVLVPLMAFCSKCLIDALFARINGNQDNSSTVHGFKDHCGSKSMRWKSALGDINELDTLDSGSIPDSKNPSEDQAQNLIEDECQSDAYSKLESDYQKFLSECGMSKSGYWRGGSPK